MKDMRADRFLVTNGFGTRTEVKKWIRAGRLSVNGIPVPRPEEKLDPLNDEIALDGKKISFDEFEYWVLNKPAGILTATEDRHRETVISYMGLTRKDMSPCGRLDIDTEGLLLITDDGQLIHKLLAPGKHVDKVYRAEYEGTLPADAAERIAGGIVLEDGMKCMPAVLNDSGNPAVITVREGKFHQVKRMFEALGCTVTHLTRLSMGPLSLASLDLKPGEFRKLTPEEKDVLTAYADRSLPDPFGYRAVLFDLDGTLVDSMWLWHDVDVQYLGKFGIRCPEDLQIKISGMSFNEVADYFRREFNIPDDRETMMREWEKMSMDAYRYRIPLKPGAEEFLKALRARNIPAAIATSNAVPMAEAVLNRYGLLPYFKFIITAEEVHAGKPRPDIYLEAARRLNVKPEDCLVFEDIPEGIEAGLNAGMRVCSVKDAFSEKMEAEKIRMAGSMIADYREFL